MSWNVQGMAKSVRRTRSRRMKFCIHGGLGDTLNKQRRKPNGYPGALLASNYPTNHEKRRDFSRV